MVNQKQVTENHLSRLGELAAGRVDPSPVSQAHSPGRFTLLPDEALDLPEVSKSNKLTKKVFSSGKCYYNIKQGKGIPSEAVLILGVIWEEFSEEVTSKKRLKK